jgi:hypothetical protein
MEKTAGVSSRDIVGYLLIIIGVSIILTSLWNGYSIFQRTTKPVALFSLPGISMGLTKIMAAQLPDSQSSAPQTATAEEIIPAKSVNDPLNLFTHIFLLGFFATIGSKIAIIGVDLTRPYIIKDKKGAS